MTYDSINNKKWNDSSRCSDICDLSTCKGDVKDAEILSFYYCKLKEVPDVSHIKNLKQLGLQGNKIKSGDMSVLRNDKLEVLDLDDNKIRDSITNLPRSLKKLSVSRNKKVSHIDPTLPNLTHIHLIYNNLKDENALTIPKVKFLNIGKNFYKHVPDLPDSIRNLDISHNRYLEVVDNLPPNLEVLDIRSIRLEKAFGESECVKVDFNSPRLKVLMQDSHQSKCIYPGINHIDFVINEHFGPVWKEEKEVWDNIIAYQKKREKENWS